MAKGQKYVSHMTVGIVEVPLTDECGLPLSLALLAGTRSGTVGDTRYLLMKLRYAPGS